MLHLYPHFCWSNQEIDISCVIQTGVYITFFFFFLQLVTTFLGEGNSNPLQYSCLENPMDGRASWAAVYGVTQSRTGLTRLSSSSGHFSGASLVAQW